MTVTYDWDKEKNKLLISSRGVSFEHVVAIIESGAVLDILDHPNQEKYSHQQMYVVEINNYTYLVPFVANKNKVFLKTIIPCRKAHKKYIGNKHGEPS